MKGFHRFPTKHLCMFWDLFCVDKLRSILIIYVILNPWSFLKDKRTFKGIERVCLRLGHKWKLYYRNLWFYTTRTDLFKSWMITFLKLPIGAALVPTSEIPNLFHLRLVLKLRWEPSMQHYYYCRILFNRTICGLGQSQTLCRSSWTHRTLFTAHYARWRNQWRRCVRDCVIHQRERQSGPVMFWK